MDFRSRLREEIEYSGLLYKEVAAKAGISKRTMDSYVGTNGSMPAADVAVRLAQTLGVTVEYLITGQDGTQKLTKQEQHILSCFGRLSVREKNALEQYLVQLAAEN